ncbi:LOW QUALITY PROTEIN: protein TASOR, partial [Danio aesculapii]|uniref:LOW QUALITY PROTEIN: protein TASOR n=1 Tax=Danio aesculapii TaxID=1142201 RepID=UPI0024BF34BA
MEHRGEKYSNNEKDNPAAPSWSQNGATEEEYGCSDGPGEERRVKSGSRAAKPAEKQPRLNFHIPRKSREKRALFQNVSTDSREFSDILQILTSCYKDSSSTGMFVYSKPRLVHSEPLEKDFMEKRRELKADGRTEKELSETFCFLLSDAQKVSVVCEKGLSVGSSWINMLGNPSKGVYLCQFSDLLQINPFEPGTTGDIIIFKVIKGRVKSVHDCISRYPDNRTSRGIDPTPKFDSHFSKSSTRVTSLLSHMAFEYTQQYFYEYVDFEISSRPRHVCPYAVVSYYFKGKEASTVIPKPLPPFRSNSQPAGTSLGRHCYTVWRGHFVNGGKDVYQACLRSLSQPFLPYKLPEKIEIGKVMRLQQVKQKIPSSIFSWNLYTGSHEVFKSGMVCSLFDVVEEDKSPKSLRALMQKLEEEGLVLVNMVKDRGFLFLLSVGQLTNSSERRNGWKMSSMQALFVYSEKRGTLKSSSNPSESCNPVSSDFQSSMMPQHDSFISALHYSLSKSRSDPPAELGTTIEHQVYDYLTNLCEGKPVQRIRTDYDPKLDVREKLFPAPRQKNNWESFMRPYIFNPAKFTMVQENMKKKVEQLQFQPDQSTRKAASQNDPVKVKELLKLIQMNRKGSQGETGSPEAMEGTCTLKRKVDLDDHEESSKRHRNQSTAEEGEMQTSPTLTNVLSSAGLQDTDLRKDKNQGALKVIEMLDSFGKTSLDTDLRKDKAQGVLEVIKLIDTLTRGATQSSEDTEMKDTIDVSDAALFNSMSRLGLPTDRDIDLRKRFRNDEPEKPDSLEKKLATDHLEKTQVNRGEEETAGSLSSLEAFSPCSDSGGQQRGVNLLGEKTIPWVLIPITGLKTERYSQRKKDYPEDPASSEPTVSTHNTPDIKDLSPTYQPDSSNTVADLDVQTTAEVEDDDPVTPSVNTSTEALANAAPTMNGVDHIVDELISGFSSEVEAILRGNNIYYVSCLNNQSSREPPQAPVPPLSDYVLNFTTPFPVCNYVSSLHDRMMKFIHGNQHSEAQEDVSSSSLPTEDPSDVPDTSSNVCASSSSTTKPNKSFEFHRRPMFAFCALPEPVTQAQHQSGLPDVHKLPQKIWPLEQDSVAQQITEASIIDDLKQGSHEVSGSSVAETMEADEGQMSCSAVPAEDASMDHTHSAISSIIHQLQPEMITNLVEILKGVQKNTVYFYIHSLEEESDVCWEIKEYLKKLGDLECNPQGF